MERSTNGSNFAFVASVGANSTAYSDGGLAAGTTYWYRVRAFNSAATSSYSNDANATTSTPAHPTAPSDLTASSAGTSQIDLTWTDNATDETGYEVHRSTDGTNFALAASLGANSSSYSDSGRAAGTTYWYRVRAVNGVGPSAYSAIASATTSDPPTQSYVATSERFRHGVITGSYTLTHADDGQRQQLTERVRNRRNSLSHEWRINDVPGTGVRTLRVQAYRTVSEDNDTFPFQVRSNGSWTTALTVTKTVDDNLYQEFVLPSSVSGTVRVRVRDSNNQRNANGVDSLFVDHIEIVVQ